MCPKIFVLCLCASVSSGCAGIDFSRADVCLRKKLEVEIPLERGVKFEPRPCKSKEIYNRIF